MDATLQLRVFSGLDLVPWLGDLARLRIEVFRDYPYLYDGDIDYERRYLELFARTPESVAVLALDGDVVVGASTGLPLDAAEEAFQRPFREAGLEVSRWFYCAESVLLPAYRGHGIYPAFFDAREQHAGTLGRFACVCFCAVERPADHPLRPSGYRPLDGGWRGRGYVRRDDLRTTFAWKDVFESEESDKPMVFWVKPL